MNRSQQVSRHRELEQQLIEAYTERSCDEALIQRLTSEMAATRRHIRHLPPDDERADHTTPQAPEVKETPDASGASHAQVRTRT